MEILAWLVPAGVVTVVAMLWAAWAGRPRPDDRAVQAQRRDADHEKLARAITRQHPGASKPRPCVTAAPASPYARRGSSAACPERSLIGPGPAADLP